LKAAGNDFFKNKNYENAKRPIEILASTDNEEFMELLRSAKPQSNKKKEQIEAELFWQKGAKNRVWCVRLIHAHRVVSGLS